MALPLRTGNLDDVSRSISPEGFRAPARVRAGRAGVVLSLVSGLIVLGSAQAHAALPDTSNPALRLARTIRTSPFVGSSVSMKDSEGGTYVPEDDSLWLAGDNDRALFEVDRVTGELKRKIDRTALEAAIKFGGGPAAGPNRSADLESMAYDAQNDHLYAFVGTCCTSTVLPTVFRLARDGAGQFQVESYQPLSSTADFTAAAWNPSDGKVWVAQGRDFHTYDYATNTTGPIVRVANLIGILGIGFSDDGQDVFAVTNEEMLVRADWASKTIVNGWTFDLRPFEVLDSRAVELIGDQLFVSDGADGRPAGDPLAHAVFVFDVVAPSATAPTASFTATPTSGEAPLTVTFTNTSSGDPIPTVSWDFGDGASSTNANPTHTYGTPGDYTVTLTATNSQGSDTETALISVEEASAPTNLVGNPGFETGTGGWGTVGGGSGVQLDRISGGHSGDWSARLFNNAGAKRKCLLTDQPNWVATTAAGTYTASIWVRGEAGGATFKLMLKETGGAVNGSKTVTRTLTTGWQLVTVAYVTRSPGTSTLDLQAFVPRASAPIFGPCLYADDVSLLRS
jgi:PKD repeat protein